MPDFNGWKFDITETGRGDLERLDHEVEQRVIEKLKWFTANFQSIAPIPLGGHWRGFFKLRVGDWRIIYDVNQEVHCVTVHVIDKRDKIYKRKHDDKKFH